MKLYSILLVLATSLTPQTSWLLAGAQNESTAGTAKVEGDVRSRVPPRGPVQDATVKLFPDPGYLKQPDLIRTARTDQFGTYRIENVVPGKYRAIAFPPGGHENLADQAKIAANNGTRIELSQKESKTLTLYLYAAE